METQYRVTKRGRQLAKLERLLKRVETVVDVGRHEGPGYWREELDDVLEEIMTLFRGQEDRWAAAVHALDTTRRSDDLDRSDES